MTAVRYTIRARYIDLKKLKSLLCHLFGSDWEYDVCEMKVKATLREYTHVTYSNGTTISPSQLRED